MPGADDLVQYLNSGGDPAQAGVNPEVPAAGVGADYASLLGYPPSQPSNIGPPPAAPSLPMNQPVTSPDQVADPASQEPQQVAPSTPSPQLGSAGAKVSASGYSPSANAAIQAGPKKGVEAGLARDRAQVESEFAPLVKESHEATQAAIDAELKVHNIESDKLRATAESKLKIAAANKEFMVKEQAAVDNARAEADHSHAEYRAALADYSASKVNPKQLWENAGAGGQFAMMVTAFAHDFLGAKGIETSGLKTINTAIQNNINAQLENIRKKENVAQGFKQLWDMQRAQSATDAEARQRMQGFYLAALSNGIEAQLGGYDSDLALAKGQAAKAKLMEEQVKNDLLVRQHIDTSANQRATNRVHMYSAELSASSAKYSADAHVKAAQIAADKPKGAPALLIDTSKTGGNVAIRKFLPNVPPEKTVEIQTNYSKSMNTVENINHLIELQDQIGKVPPTDLPAIKKMQGEAARTAELVRNVVRMGLVYDASGKQINEQEMKIYNELVSKKDWWVNGNNVRTLGTLGRLLSEKNDAIISGLTVELQPGEPGYGATTGAKTGNAGARAADEIYSQPGGGSPEETDADKYQKWALAPNVREAYSIDKLPDKGPGSKPAVQHDWAQFRKDHPEADPEKNTETGGFLEKRGGATDFTAVNPENPDRGFIQMERLADLALSGDKKARAALDTFAAGKPAEGAKGEDAYTTQLLSAYAQWEKAQKGL